MKTANFIFDFDTKEDADIILKSLSPEIKQKIVKTDIKIYSSGSKILLEINADDISSLRAACNSYLRWIKTALDVKKTV